jgi:membrane fusion protein, heavy metal efflux system
MKSYKLIMFLLLFSYFSFSCGNKTEQDEHDHSADASHVHDEGQPHTHTGDEVGTEDAAHVHDESQPHTHEQTTQTEDAAHTHEGETEPHVHETDDPNQQDDPIHTTEGMLTVEAEWEKMIGLKTVLAEYKPIDLVVKVPGKIIPNQNQVAIISPFIESSVNCIFANVGDRVKEGDLLLCLISPEIGILRAEHDRAKADLNIKIQNFERRKKLFDENIISEKSYQEAQLEKNVAEVSYNYAHQKLLAMGVTEDEVENPPTDHSDAIGSTIHIKSPIDGVVTFRNASIGQKVDNSSKIYEIMNLDNVWLEADIFEKDLTKIKMGQSVNVRVSAYENEMFTGKIFYIGSTLHKITKTIKIMVEIPNRSERLKPGMFANTNILIGRKENALVIPKAAVLEDENLQVVFIKETEGYHRHVIQTGIISDNFVEIISGIGAKSVVVTQGNYQLKSKMKMSGIDPHAGHVH